MVTSYFFSPKKVDKKGLADEKCCVGHRRMEVLLPRSGGAKKNSPDYRAEAEPREFSLAQTLFGFIRLHFHAEPSRIYAEHVEVAQAKPAYFDRLSINFSKAGLATLGVLYFSLNFKMSNQK